MNHTLFAALVIVLSAPLAQAQRLHGMAEENKLEVNSLSATVGAASAENAPGVTGVVPSVSIHYENGKTAKYVWDADRLEVDAGYTPEEYLHLRYEIGQATGPNSSMFLLLPYIGDTTLRASANQLQAPKPEGGYNLSNSTTYFGVGYRTFGNLNPSGTSNIKANIDLKYLAISEMLPPGQYNMDNALANYRPELNRIYGTGFGASFKAQLVLMNRFLLGVSGSTSWVHTMLTVPTADATDTEDKVVNYRDADGQIYASMRISKRRKVTIDISAKYYMRLTNMNDLREVHPIQIPSLGLKFTLH